MVARLRTPWEPKKLVPQQQPVWGEVNPE